MVVKQCPSRSFQEIATDFCSHGGHQFLIVVDCCTDWPEIIYMGKNTTATRFTGVLLGVFSRYGVPDIVWSDRGPQFTSHTFQSFAKDWEFRHITSSPTCPQSNGKAESAVKSMKKIIRGSWTGYQLDQNKLARSLLQYRNTPSRRDGTYQHKSYMDSRFRTPYQHTASHFNTASRNTPASSPLTTTTSSITIRKRILCL